MTDADPLREPGGPAPEEVVEATPELDGRVGGIEVQAAEPSAPRYRRELIPEGIRYMLLGALCFSVMSLLVKVAGQRLPSQQVVLVRAAVMLLLSYWAVRRARVPLRGQNRPLLITRGVVGFIGLSGFYYAVVHLPLADATVIQYTNPVFATLIAVRVLREPLELREVLVVLTSLAGVVLVARPAFLPGAVRIDPLDPFAVGVGLIGALASAAAYVIVRRLSATEHPMVIVYYFALVSVIASLPLSLFNALWPTPVEWLVLLGVGVTTQFGQVFITRGLRLERAGRATATGYLQIVFAAGWGILFFAEYPDLATWAGAALIIGSTMALTRGGTASTRRPA